MTAEKYREKRKEIEQRHRAEADFSNQWGLAAIRAEQAYAHVELERGTSAKPGSGQTVGLIDTGIDTGHPMFSGKTLTENIISGFGDSREILLFRSQASHGTAVASVIAGDPSASFTTASNAPRGVARGADIAMFAIDAGAGGGPYTPITVADLGAGSQSWVTLINPALSWNSRKIDFLNLSVGYNGIIDQYSEQDLRDNFASAIAAFAQATQADKTVLVWAAGNGHGSMCHPPDFSPPFFDGTEVPDLCVNQTLNAKSANVLAGLPARISELQGHSIAVVAVAPDSDNDGDYEIASFSNRCGIAANWCIAAPGVGVRSAYFGPDPDDDTMWGVRGAANFSGTSLAAPMVTGGLVLLKDFFRSQLSNTELASRLLTTANRTGIYSDSSVYGQGLMDLGAATEPVGVTTVILGDTVNHSSGDSHEGLATLNETRFTPGSALGDSLPRAFAGYEVAAFDSLGAPFWSPLDELLQEPVSYSGYSLAARLEGFMAQSGPLDRSAGTGRMGAGLSANTRRLQPGLLKTSPFAGVRGHLSLAQQALTFGAANGAGLSLAAFSTEGMDTPASVSGAVLSWSPADSSWILQSGLLSERETLLGSHSAGAFGDVSDRIWFAGIGSQTMAGAWRIETEAEIGAISPLARDGLFDRISPLVTSAFALRAHRALAGGASLSFSLSQPIRVESGHARLMVPVGRTWQGRALHQSLTATLEPGGRQLDFTVQWNRVLPGGGELRLGGGYLLQPGHDATARAERLLMAGWRYGF